MRKLSNPGATNGARTIVRRAARLALVALTLLVSTLAGVVLHVNTAAGRRYIAREVNALVSGLITSELKIEKIDQVSFDRLLVARARLLDRQGRPIFTADRLEARFGLVTILRGVLGGKEVRVHVPDVTIDHFGLGLSEDPARRNHFTLESAFDSRTPPSGGPVTPVFVELPHINVKTATVTTNLRALATSNARLDALSAGLMVSTEGVVLELSTKDARIARVLAQELRGKLGGHVRLPGATTADFDIRAGAAPVTGTFGFDQGKLDMRARSTALEPAAMRELFGAWPLIVPLAANAQLVGPPETMQARAEGAAGATRITTTGRMTLAPEVTLGLDFAMEQLDLRIFSGDAPQTALEVKGHVEIRFEPELEVRATASIPESEVSGVRVPPLDADARYAGGRVKGSAKSLDPHLPATLDFEVEPSGRIQYAAEGRNFDLKALAGYGVKARGRATVRAQGVYEAGRVDATFDAHGTSLELGGVRAGSLAATGRVRGVFDQPGGLHVEGSARGNALSLGSASFEHFEARSAGAGKEQRVTLELVSPERGKLEASANARFGKPVTLSAVRVRAERGDAEATFESEEASFQGGRVVLRGVSLQAGEGKLEGSAELFGPRERVDFTAKALDLAVLAKSLGFEAANLSGVIDGHVRIEEVNGQRTGEARLEARDVKLGELGAVRGTAVVDFEGPGVDARVSLEAPGLAKATLEAKGKLEGSLAAPRLLERSSGEATLRLEGIELGEVSRRFLDGSGVGLAGRADAEFYLTRRTREEEPALAYQLKTEKMVVSVVRKHEGQAGRSELETHLDITSRGELFTDHGSNLSATVLDARGPWVEVEATHAFNAEALAHAFEQGSAEAALDAPLRARVTALRRPMSAFSGVGLSTLEGDFAGVVGVSGTLRDPELSGAFELNDLDVPVVGGDKVRLQLLFLYSDERRRYALEAHTHSQGADHIELRGSGTLRTSQTGPQARFEATISRLDLTRIGSVIDLPVAGTVSGRGTLELGEGDFNATGDLTLEAIEIEQRHLGNGAVRVRSHHGKSEASFRIGDARSKLELSIEGGLLLRDNGLAVDQKVDRELELEASNFELANVGPWLKKYVTQLSGKLNGHADLRFTNAGNKPETKFRANATISNATASLTAGGGMLRSIEVSALADEGEPLKLKFSGAARSRKPNLEGTAEVHLKGLALERFDAKVRVDGFPLVYEGVLLGKATIARGMPPLGVVIEKRAEHDHIAVSVPAVEVSLPDASETSLIALEDDPAITIVELRKEVDALESRKKADRGTTFGVELGKRVHVVQGELKVPVRGGMQMDSEGRLSGTLRFPPGGVVPALGHTFRIKDGFVRFKEQPVNEGVVSIQATTRAPDGTAVELNVSGTVGTPVLIFQSDPPRSEDEIVALLVGLRPEENHGEQGSQLGGVAWALAMNRLVKGSALSRLQFGAGQTSEGNEVKTISMRVSNKVWLEGRSVRGSDTSLNQNDNASGVVDWRFAPSFSLRTQLGTVSGVELRWSHGY